MAIKNWKINGQFVCISYQDGMEVTVAKADFDRAFGTIISAPREEIIRDFAVTMS